MLLITSFVLLIAGLVALWCFRFEQLPHVPALTLVDLRKASPMLLPGAVWEGSAEHPILRLRVDGANPRIGLRLNLPGFPAMEALHLKISMAAKDLKLGSQNWNDGRTLIEWCPPGAIKGQEVDPICSHQDNESCDDISLVVRASSGSAIPVLRVEHLGLGGELEVTQLEMIPVKQSAIWKIGRWVTLAGFFGWLWVWLMPTGASTWRNALVSAAWLLMGVQFAVPGPWKTLRPLIVEFEIGKVPADIVRGGDSPNGIIRPPSDGETGSPSASEPLGKIPEHGSWLVQAKSHLAMFRPVLHALLLFVPALAFAILVGRKRALQLAVALTLSIEAAQAAFGYGFDWVDVFDLLCDAVGIALAMWVHVWVQRWYAAW